MKSKQSHYAELKGMILLINRRFVYLYTVIRSIHINKLFPKHLFWDVDMSRLAIDKDSDLIIPRALMATTPLTFTNDIAKLELIYPRAVIARELKTTKERVSDQICHLVARRYHIKKFARFSK